MVITSRHQWARAASGRGYLTFLHIGHFVVRCGCTHRFADIESGAKTIREYQPGAMYGVLQTPAYTWALIEHAKAEGPITYISERLVEARLQRRRTVLRSGGPVFPPVTGMVAALMPKSPLMIFTFPDASDPPMAVVSTIFTIWFSPSQTKWRVTPADTGMYKMRHYRR
jgi:hypothetical protein